MRRSVCWLINQITAENYATLFNCTPIDRVSDFVCCLVHWGFNWRSSFASDYQWCCLEVRGSLAVTQHVHLRIDSWFLLLHWRINGITEAHIVWRAPYKNVRLGYSIYSPMKQQKLTFNSYNLFLDVILLQNMVNMVLLIAKILRFTPWTWARKNSVWSAILNWDFADKVAEVVFDQAFIKTNAFNWFKRDYNSHSFICCQLLSILQYARCSHFSLLWIQINQQTNMTVNFAYLTIKQNSLLSFRLCSQSFKTWFLKKVSFLQLSSAKWKYLPKNKSISLWWRRKCIYLSSACQFDLLNSVLISS